MSAPTASTPSSSSDLSHWKPALDKATGRTYYWNIKTRETRWDLGHLEVDTKEDLEKRRVQAATEDNQHSVELMLATFGWNGLGLNPPSILSFAKSFRGTEAPVMEQFVRECKLALELEQNQVAKLAEEANARVLEMERLEREKRANQKLVLVGDNRKQLDEFLRSRQNALSKDEEAKQLQLATNRARAEKKIAEREKYEVLGTNLRTSTRPRREVKSRFVEHPSGYQVLKANLVDSTPKQPVAAAKDVRAPLTAYALFSREEIKRIREAGETATDFTSIQKQVSKRWKEMSEEDKLPFRELAAQDKDRVFAERLSLAQALVAASTPASTPATPVPISTPASIVATPDGEDDDDEEDELAVELTPPPKEGGDEEEPKDAAESKVSKTIRQKIAGQLPRPTLFEVVDCAMLAIGPKSGVSALEVEKWITTSPLGQKLASRLELAVTVDDIKKTMQKCIQRGWYVFSIEKDTVMSNARLQQIPKMESAARRKRARRQITDNPGKTYQTSSIAQARMQHNEGIKRALFDSLLFRWAFMLKRRAALDPFLSETASQRLTKFGELLALNDLQYLADETEEDTLPWLYQAMLRCKQQLGLELPHLLPPPEPLTVQPKCIVNGVMREYQLRGVNWLVKQFFHGVNSVLADEMGLGKTLQTITFLSYLKLELNISGPFLVIVPLSVLTNWANEFRKWCPELRVIKLHSSNKEERDKRRKEVMNQFRDFDVVITTYEMIMSTNMKNTLTSKIWWRCVVIDEGHKIKNDETGLSQTVRSMNCQFRLLLTGTPLQNNLRELWALLNFLDPVTFDSPDKFDSGFDLAKDVVDRNLLNQAHYLLRPFCLRRTKLEVETKLPPKEEIQVHVPLSEMQMFWYKRLILNDAALLERVEDSLTTEGNAAAVTTTGGEQEDVQQSNDWKRLQSLMMQLRKCCNHPYLFPGAEPDFDGSTSEDLVSASGKLQTLDILLRILKEKGHRVVIFSQFTSMLDILSDFLHLRNYKHARLDGGTNRVQRAVDVLQYNQADSTQFAYLMSTRAGGLGINLATADTVILFDSDYNPQVDLQAMDRVHRIGQEKPVHIYRLVTKGTIEERIVHRAKKKLFLDSMVNRGSTAMGEALESLSKAEMLKMLKFGASAVFGDSGDGGEACKLLTDEEVCLMIDRSDEAILRRSTPAEVVTVPSQENALEFDEKTQPMRLRDLYGKDFVQETISHTTTTATVEEEEEPARKRTKFSAMTPVAIVEEKNKQEEEDEVWEEVGTNSIADQWKKAKFGTTSSTTKSGRQVKNRFTEVDGYRVLHQNMYTLDEGEKSVFHSELANRRRGPDSATLEEINRSFGRGRQVVGRDYTNETHCLSCWDGGELVMCDQCPVSIHVECLNENSQHTAVSGKAPTWRCPHHSCVMCDRKSAAVGGLLFRCTECPNSYCEDHLPLEGLRLHEGGRCLRMEELGFRKPSQAYFILCSPKCIQFFHEREELGVEQAILNAIDRNNQT
ncbi:hypothetical protein BASA81_006494 [Batrachochytrium salamandrivorans]|nr:hypothetical protein BASA81_006494 [Batrachochytrium salamandrivorans]